MDGREWRHTHKGMVSVNDGKKWLQIQSRVF